jgi:hypothetical protein
MLLAGLVADRLIRRLHIRCWSCGPAGRKTHQTPRSNDLVPSTAHLAEAILRSGPLRRR